MHRVSCFGLYPMAEGAHCLNRYASPYKLENVLFSGTRLPVFVRLLSLRHANSLAFEGLLSRVVDAIACSNTWIVESR